MVRNVTGVMAGLESEGFYLLSSVEQGMRFGEWVNREKLPKGSGLTAEEVDYRIDRCMTREFVERKTIQYVGYKLTVGGYDALVLRTFTQRDTIQGFGVPLGVGKEDDVFEVQSFKPLTLKSHREGYTNLREVRHERDYTSENHHASWFCTARKAVERKYEAPETPFPEVSVPRPVDHNRHAITMARFDGTELAKAKLEFEQVTGILDLILSEMADAYAAGYVHADMSEYNATVGERSITVFDWSQAAPIDHDNARELLARDVKGIVDYFRRKYPDEIPNEVNIGVLSDAIARNESESTDEFTV